METYDSVKSQLKEIFRKAVENNKSGDFLKSAKVILAKSKASDVKAIVELTIRNVLIDFIKERVDSSLLERLFQFSIDAAMNDIALPTLPVLVIGDMFEIASIENCEKYFSFVENRVDIFKKEMFFKACKNNLLRSCNDLLKRLSRSQNTVFCGRILMFLAHIFPLSERSGLNIVSEFNLENTTAYSTNDDMFSDLTSEKGDTEEGEISTQNQNLIMVDKTLYQKFWSLQDFFRNPNNCYNKMQWRQFVSCTQDILTVFGSFKSDDANSSKWKQATLLPSPSGSSVYFAKYLTSPKLLELELSDSHFRRYVLVQFLILFQYLLTPVKFKLEAYVLTEEQQNVVKDTTKKIYKLLEETPPNGETFARDVEQILQREEYWNAWKNEGCPDFKHLTDKSEIEKRLKKRPGQDLYTYPNKKRSSEAAKVWSVTPNNWEACKSAKRNFVPSLETFFGIAGKSDPAFPPYKRDMADSKYTWKALRLLCMKSPLIFTASSAPAKSTTEYLETVIQKLAKEKPQTQQDVMMVETEVDETMEDTNDEFLPAAEKEVKVVEVKKEKDVLTKEMIGNISEKLQDNWQTLAKKLGFHDDENEYYESSFPTPKAAAEQMLTVWMERDGSLPTFSKVLQSLGLLGSVQSFLTP